MRGLELRIPPLALVLLAALLMWLISVLTSSARLYLPGSGLAATAVAICGSLICLAGVAQFRRSRTTVNPMTPEASSALVTHGIYRFTRNPMYLGFAIILLGWMIFLENPLTLAVVLAFVLYINRFQIEPEERALESTFGAEFKAYKLKTRRWI